MCGIAGVVLPPGSSLDASVVMEMLHALEHRGPDDHGWLSMSGGELRKGREDPPDGELAMVNCRLSIIDLSSEGWQPMSSPDGRFHMVYNGEIYNYLELRAELEQEGWQFHSHSDTEVLLAGFAMHGPSWLRRLVGMFAFAMLDMRARRLTLARDFFGIKPLYYATWGGGVAFGSELRALLGLKGLRRTINAERLYQYLRFGLTDHDDETMLADVRQLPAAHYMEIDLDRPAGHLVPVRYWAIPPDRQLRISFDEATARLRDLFVDSVKLHLRSDVPVGVAFSGGIDSSSLLATMRQLAGPNLDLHAFAYIAEGKNLSEEPWVDLVGGVNHATVHKVRPNPHELLEDLDELILAQGEPFRSTSVYAQYRVFQAAHEAGIKVTLDGQGADEILGGYRFYIAARIASCLRQGQVLQAATLANGARQLPAAQATRMMLQAGGFLLPSRLQSLARRLVGADLVPRGLNADWFAARGVTTSAIVPYPSARILRAALRVDLQKTSLPSLLRYEDRNAMAHSVEGRVPFLTPEIVEFCFSLPESYLVDANGTSKAIFRQAMRGIVPDSVLDRRDKIGFETPELVWMRSLQAWVSETISGLSGDRIPALDHTAVRDEWEAMLSGRKHFDSRVWRWVNVIRWSELLNVRMDP